MVAPLVLEALSAEAPAAESPIFPIVGIFHEIPILPRIVLIRPIPLLMILMTPLIPPVTALWMLRHTPDRIECIPDQMSDQAFLIAFSLPTSHLLTASHALWMLLVILFQMLAR